MGRGLLAGAFWGGLLSLLVLVVAALSLEGRKAGLGEGDAPEMPVIAAPLPAPPDTAPVLPRGAAHLAALPEVTARDDTRPRVRDRGLVPRPAKPQVPELLADRAPRPAFAQGIPPIPARQAAVLLPGALRLDAPSPPAPDRPPAAAQVGPETPDAPAPTRLVAPAQPSSDTPDLRQTAPGPLIAAASAPSLPVPPQTGAEGVVAMTLSEVAPRPVPDAPGIAPPADAPGAAPQSAIAQDPPAPALLASPLRDGPRIAFILAPEAARNAAPGGPLPEWLMNAPSGGPAPFAVTLAQGDVARPRVFAPEEKADFVRLRMVPGARALLAYAQLRTADDANAATLARLAARARRDGALSVLVGDDPALWSRIDDWLAEDAGDLVPVPAAALVP